MEGEESNGRLSTVGVASAQRVVLSTDTGESWGRFTSEGGVGVWEGRCPHLHPS